MAKDVFILGGAQSDFARNMEREGGGLFELFRDVAECPDALFFDGAVSSLAWGNHMEIDAGEPAGPVVAVFRKQDD